MGLLFLWTSVREMRGSQLFIFDKDFMKIALFLCILSIVFILDMTGTGEKAVCDHVTHEKSSSRQKLHLVFSLLFPLSAF